ncbi:hypothetical protein CDIK_0536 [Cucumispora dikerogammari]|nr:hypothetical protein CDIK_0536 [Cucumispora dikerogammari]
MKGKSDFILLMSNLTLSLIITFTIENNWAFYAHKSLRFNLKYFSSNFLLSILLSMSLAVLLYYIDTKNSHKMTNLLKKTLWYLCGLIMLLSLLTYINTIFFYSDKNSIFFTPLSYTEMCLLFSGSELICILLFSIIFIESYIYLIKENHIELYTIKILILRTITVTLSVLLLSVSGIIIFKSEKWFLILYCFILSLCIVVPCSIIVLNSLIKQHRKGYLVFK